MQLASTLRLLIIYVTLSAISGCVSYQYLPDPGAPVNPDSTTELPVPLKIEEPQLSYDQSHFSEKDWQKTHPVLSRSFNESLSTLPRATDSESPSLEVNLESTQIRGDKKQDFKAMLTLGILPTYSDTDFKSAMVVRSDGTELFRSESQGTLRRHMSLLLPTPITWKKGNLNPEKPGRDMVRALQAQHLNRLEQWVTAQRNAFAPIADKDIYTQRQWLIDNPDNLFSSRLLTHLARSAPKRDAITWHQENVKQFPGYTNRLSEKDAFWFIGPPQKKIIDLVNAAKGGKDQSILAAHVENGGPYKNFSDSEIQLLKNKGLSSELIAAMIRSNAKPHAQSGAIANQAASPRISQQDTVAALLIPDNSGEYMSPWTSDGVLAEWVDKAINAKMGSAIGSAAGAYAAQKALNNVPFIGGFLGSKVGKEVGRTAAISASGGMDYIRQTSDQSFRNLEDMARYLKAVHATNSNFQDAIKAADAIYPGLMQSLASAQ